MKVKVCDAICGKGKTSAAINMMNGGDENNKYIFITQFLTEVDRIAERCKRKGFVAPDDTECTKANSLNELIMEEKNIVATHSLFLAASDETKRLLAEKHYTLILDEVVDVMNMAGLSESDIKILKDSNSIKEEDGEIVWSNEDYDATDKRSKFQKEALVARSKRLHKYEDGYFFWSIPTNLFTSFNDVYLLTYMFTAQPLKCFFEINNIEYEYIGVKNAENGYEFCPAEEMDRRLDLRSKINILDHKKLNAIGNKHTDLSYTWYTLSQKKERAERQERIRKNLVNVKRNVFKCDGDDFMWTSFKTDSVEIKDKGFKNGFVVYNKRASNEYCNKHYLAYCVNNYPRPWEAKYYREHGSTLDGNMYALSILVQWIFRSAIRKGEEIWLYLPSSRMRKLLIKWLDNLAEGKDLETIVIGRRKKNNETEEDGGEIDE